MDRILILPFDIAVLVIYFIIVLAAGVYAMCRSNRSSARGYFLAGQFMTWLPVGASLFASNIGSEHFIGLAGSGAANGIAVGAFEFNAALLLQLLGWVFLPVYISSGAYTLPEYMRKRFGGTRIQIYLTVLSLLLYILTKISVNLYSGSLFIEESLGWNIWYAIPFLLGLTSLITLTGGLTAVLYTDLVQCVVMICGSIILTSMGFYQIGGFPGLLSKYGKAISPIDAASPSGSSVLINLAEVQDSVYKNSTSSASLSRLVSSPKINPTLPCTLPSSKAFIMLRGLKDKEMPWLGFLLGQTAASIWYWCADQMIVQRALAAKSISHAQGATLIAGFIKLTPLFIMVMPGMISRILYPEVIGCLSSEDCINVCGNPHGCMDLAYPKLVMGIMPSGLRGLMLAVMLSALITDLTSIFNSASTLFTIDIYTRIRKNAQNRELVIVGRLFVIFMIILSIFWVPVMQVMQGGQLFIYIQSVSACLAPPIAAVYLMAILWKRANESGAFYSLMYGLAVGLVRMTLGFVYTNPLCVELDSRPWIIRKFHYMYFAMFSFVSTIIVMASVSLLSKPPTSENLVRTTYWTRMDIPVKSSIILKEALGDAEDHEQKYSEVGILQTDNNTAILPHENCETHIVKNAESNTRNMTEKYYEEIHPKRLQRVLRVVRSICAWMCGLSDIPCPDESDREGHECQSCCMSTGNDYRRGCVVVEDEFSNDAIYSTADKALEKDILQIRSPSLKQDRETKMALYIGLFSISSITVFSYLFFTFYFGEIEQGPIHVYNNTALTEDILQAITKLKNTGIIVAI